MNLPRLMLAAPASGSGKTTLTCALLWLLQKHGLRPAALKCGPDYIDPMYHREVIGVRSGNLDLFFTGEETVRALLAQTAGSCNFALLEGVMGYYDGLGGCSEQASSYHLARATATPVVLLLDARGASLTLAATLRGLTEFRPQSGIAGVILNHCPPTLYSLLQPMLERESGLPVLGYLPHDPAFALESRHLGLVTAQDVPRLREKLAAVAGAAEQTLELERLVALANSAPPLPDAPALSQRLPSVPLRAKGVRLGVAQDAAFCFAYRENLELMQMLGTELIFFSPLTDRALPKGLDGLYFCGGYPELHAGALAENAAMRAEIAEAAARGMPVLAECGGFLYLQQALRDMQGKCWPMCGVLPGEGFYTGRLRRFGYQNLTAGADNLLLRAGETLPAHEFHYYDSTDCGAACEAVKPLRNTSWRCVQAGPRLFAGFPHLYFWAAPAAAQRFVCAMADYREGIR